MCIALAMDSEESEVQGPREERFAVPRLSAIDCWPRGKGEERSSLAVLIESDSISKLLVSEIYV